MNHLVLPTLSEILVSEGTLGDRGTSGYLKAQQQVIDTRGRILGASIAFAG